MKYKLAIIIPVYNAEKYLADCLDSVFTQLKQDMLIIAVDDGSTDKSACILFEYKKAYSNRLYIISKKNGGLSSARNEGLTIAKKISTYTMFLDSDDLLNSSAIEEFLAIINDHHPSLIEFNIIRFGFGSEKKIYCSASDNKLHILDQSFLKNVIDRSLWFTCSRIYKTYLFDEITFPNGRRYEDVITTPQIYLKCDDVFSSSSCLLKYRDNPEGITRNPTLSDINDLIHAYSTDLGFDSINSRHHQKKILDTTYYVSGGLPLAEIYNVTN
ncbi:TPA: glycosyltransferase family 2 protein, partial [Escherichia coli]|nr:glycosyltransferase family 2 protein [Escherichia coli]